MAEPFVLVRPNQLLAPILLSSPHSGLFYPAEARRRLGVSADTLSTLNDGPVHELFGPAMDQGATLIRAIWSRAWIDLNRDPAELDDGEIADVPARQPLRRSLRVQAGLGVVPTHLGGRLVHQRRPAFSDVASRIAGIHDRYHLAVDAELMHLGMIFGETLLLDCHSMPVAAEGPAALPDIVLGDLFGRSCAGALVAAAEQICRGHGFSVARNQPFAGGWISERHGRPIEGIHALQLELRRDLFFPMSVANQATRQRLQSLAASLVVELGQLLTRPLSSSLRAAE